MVTSRKRRLTEQESGEIMNNSQSDLSSEDKLLTAFDRISIDSDDENLPAEHQWHCETFSPIMPQFVGEPGLQNTISFVKRTPSSHLSDLRLKIIRGVLTKYEPQRPNAIERPSTKDSPLRLTAQHFASLIPQTSQSNQPRKKCVVCVSHNIRRDTRYICPDCDALLCIVDCFTNYHTKMNY